MWSTKYAYHKERSFTSNCFIFFDNFFDVATTQMSIYIPFLSARVSLEGFFSLWVFLNIIECLAVYKVFLLSTEHDANRYFPHSFYCAYKVRLLMIRVNIEQKKKLLKWVITPFISVNNIKTCCFNLMFIRKWRICLMKMFSERAI